MSTSREARRPLRIALLGTRGVPARYGGFETCVDEVGRRLAARGHEVVVYCRTTTGADATQREYAGMRLVHLPALRRRSLETLSHSGLSAVHLAAHRVDAAVVFNAANAPWLPLLRAARIPVATHVDGLEWKRGKWGPAGRKYYRLAESMAVRWSDALIADAAGIQDYYTEQFGAASRLITYGAPIIGSGPQERLAELGLEAGRYHLVVARFEPENHVHLIVEGYTASEAQLPLVVVGGSPYGDEYTRRVRDRADERVRFLGGVWDQELLDQLYANALIYWHGHSVGGTNPSLLRAIGAAAPTNAFDVNFNREVLAEAGSYFSTAAAAAALAVAAEAQPEATKTRGLLGQQRAVNYDWDVVTDGYEQLCHDLHTGRARQSGGRRRPTAADRTPAGVA
ncbi:DUF1972 domain-containing protein [Arthrobacter sulfonylureivorans]|uniref:D-inositol 3-phosphate glycosyltransferase n=1 Tax=Arthrobacter sulfonylureivorans TaxID=2486855 RepID=A0ABY3W679_9MICC|nr:DUF1972 domain-containing protein [Arthrobacter sulfonylureivorans]UNK44966.1 DUF1972 domain-containing protein [Arthrobacter sulfonylureivorans]